MPRKNFGKKYEKFLYDKLKKIPNIWVYRFPSFDRITWEGQPGDFLILSKCYNVLLEVKTTIHDVFYKNNVRQGQIERLSIFDDKLENNLAFIYVFFSKFDKVFLVRLKDFITLPSTITLYDLYMVGIQINNLEDDILRVCNNGR